MNNSSYDIEIFKVRGPLVRQIMCLKCFGNLSIDDASHRLSLNELRTASLEPAQEIYPKSWELPIVWYKTTNLMNLHS